MTPLAWLFLVLLVSTSGGWTLEHVLVMREMARHQLFLASLAEATRLYRPRLLLKPYSDLPPISLN